MNLFQIITPLIYWVLVIVWTSILIFYLKKLFDKRGIDSFLKILLVILAIDAFRTLFESIYFGAWFTSLSNLIPISIYNYLAQPQIVFIPKALNLIASLLILVIIIKKWLPGESLRIETLNKLVKERTKNIEKENQIALKNEEKYRRATINSPFPIMIHAEDGEVILVNNSWVEITGYALEEINTISKWTEKAYGQKAENIKEYIDKLYTLGGAIKESEFEIKTKNGNVRIWDFSSAPLDRLPDGRRMIISTAVDITEKKQVQKNLIEREARLNSFFEASDSISFILTNIGGKKSLIEEYSRGAEKIFGYSHDEAIGMLASKLHVDEDIARFDDMHNKMKKNKIGFSGESVLIRKSGEKFPAMFTTHPIFNNTGDLIGSLGISIDISRLKNVELELKKHQQNLQNLVNERTMDLETKNIELQNKNDELEKYNQLFADREFRIKELRNEIVELKSQIKNDTIS